MDPQLLIILAAVGAVLVLIGAVLILRKPMSGVKRDTEILAEREAAQNEAQRSSILVGELTRDGAPRAGVETSAGVDLLAGFSEQPARSPANARIGGSENPT